MSLQTSKFLLEKIATLHHNMCLDEARIAPIERDLMLNYVRQLYEHFLELPVKHRPYAPQVVPVPVPTVTKPVAELVLVEMPKPVVEAPKPVVEVAKPVVETPKPVVEAPKPVVIAPKPVVEVPKPVVEVPKPIVVAPKPVVEAPKARQVSSEIAALFEVSLGTELLDRLAQAPIADLNRAFSFNDRLLYSNELFNSNLRYFEEKVKEVNYSTTYEAAQTMLEDSAILFKWTATDDRKKAARNFLKLVRRRFK
ncbi:MAG: hypothetical protein RL329_657 [Bacteroidota bacterium]